MNCIACRSNVHKDCNGGNCDCAYCLDKFWNLDLD